MDSMVMDAKKNAFVRMAIVITRQVIAHAHLDGTDNTATKVRHSDVSVKINIQRSNLYLFSVKVKSRSSDFRLKLRTSVNTIPPIENDKTFIFIKSQF